MKVFVKQLIIPISIIFLGLVFFSSQKYVSLEKYINSSVSNFSQTEASIILSIKKIFKQEGKNQLNTISFIRDYKRYGSSNVLTDHLYSKCLSYFTQSFSHQYLFLKAITKNTICLFFFFLLLLLIRGPPPCDYIENTTSIRNPHIYFPNIFTFVKIFFTLITAKISKVIKYFNIPAARTRYYQLLKIYIYTPSILSLHYVEATCSALYLYKSHILLKSIILLSACRIIFSNIKSTKFIYQKIGENYEKSLYFV